MITLPDLPAPNWVTPKLIDYGGTMRPPLGGKVLRVDRMGSKFGAEVSFPPMKPSVARVFISRLLDAKNQGIRIEFPLLGVDQGIPGAPVVDGAGQAGRSLIIRGLIPGYAFKEGFWFSIQDASGQHYLHNCRSNTLADGTGHATITITPALRVPFPNSSLIHLVKPMIEGFVDGEEWSWQIPVEQLIALSFPIEEVG